MTPTMTIPSYLRLRERRGTRDALPTWAVVQLDGLLGSGVVRADQLDGLDADQLCEVARRSIRATHTGFHLDVDSVPRKVA